MIIFFYFRANRGIIPKVCESLFSQIAEKGKSDGADSKNNFTVSFSMLEVYNDIIRDLLNPTSVKKEGLKVREDWKGGFYAQGLKTEFVNTYQEISNLMTKGSKV